MDDYKVICNGYDVTARIGDLTSTDDIAQLSMSISCKAVRNPHDKLMPAFTFTSGDKWQLFNGSTMIFRGIITKTGLDGSITANDFGVYLNKSKIIFQCNGVAADDAIRQLCQKAGVSVGSVPSMPTTITEVYIAQEPSTILSDILDKVTAERGIKYFSRVEPDRGLCIYPYPTTPIALSVQLARNLRPFDPTWSLGAVSGEDSMDDLRNQVSVYREEGDTARILATATDSGSISKYGWLQHMESADEGTTAAQAQQLASQKLRELNRLTRTRKVDNLLGADVRAGTMLRFSSDAFGLTGDWIIKQVTHTYAPQHTMSLEVIAP
ncbi:hypothetical protein [Butyricicoccus pullicaecorum]|uniref:YqbQ/XkdQ domain-containing protein n=1 Tax=Butyricicoccus pullicaecorum 1.2 TaxID=1203606 RepID=R8W027_9FIRM|nr:hypothetical protein [Butyricicoccus pullicaecorum]EOQ38320.1 hypothetical protein HMPREF1526_01350 [Butyricicoccus pullicaecorum 1.2]SKA54248.1 hypothetical protein SAMN02745978_00503 [Butyricicoccus pullicaecorum DSM 23266]